jgi:hypothetical protein
VPACTARRLLHNAPLSEVVDIFRFS